MEWELCVIKQSWARWELHDCCLSSHSARVLKTSLWLEGTSLFPRSDYFFLGVISSPDEILVRFCCSWDSRPLGVQGSRNMGYHWGFWTQMLQELRVSSQVWRCTKRQEGKDWCKLEASLSYVENLVSERRKQSRQEATSLTHLCDFSFKVRWDG